VQVKIKDLKHFIDDDNPDIYSWDKGDCSLVGLIRVLMVQEIRKAKKDPYESRWEEMLNYLENNREA